MAGIRQVQTGRDGDKLLGIGIGVPGLIRLEEGVIVASPNLPGWEDFPLRDKLEGELGCPVILENDANAAAAGRSLARRRPGRRRPGPADIGDRHRRRRHQRR